LQFILIFFLLLDSIITHLKKYILTLSVIFISSLANSQPWNANIKTENPTFFDYQNAFNEYWQGREPGKGEGYKQFKRWEWFWEQRVGLSGQFPPADINYTEWQKFISKSKIYKASPVNTNWTFIGPNTTPGGYNGLGRLNCVTFHPTDPNTLWVGSPGGGIWKTTNLGVNWTPLSDYNGVLGVSSIVVNPIHTDSIYIATGDGDKGSLWGMTGGPQGDNKSIGILLSTDGGLTWKPTGMSWAIAEAKLISKLIMDPLNSRHLLFASSDGVYITDDAGATWVKKQSGYFMDIAFCPGNSKVVYATTSSYSGSGKLYKSADGGNTFKQTFVQAHASRITIGTTEANKKKVQLLVSDKDKGKFGGIYESLDTGNTFTLKSDTGSVNILSSAHDGKGKSGQGWYDLAYTISPWDESKVMVGGVNLWKSIDSAATFKINTMWVGGTKSNPNNVQVTHADKHFLAYNPLNGYLFDCNDGGIYYSKNEGTSWTDISNGLGIMQLYRMSITESDTNLVLIGAQDNGTKIRRETVWYESTGGDGMHCAIDPVETDIFYTGIQYGKINRTDYDGTTVISDNILNKPRGAWVTPYVIDPNDHNTLYAGYKMIYKSTDRGDTWVKICDSLWKPNHVMNLAVYEGNSQIMYAADYYKIYKTINGGTTWTFISSTNLPITRIVIHPKNPHMIYYSVSSYVASGKVYKINTLGTGADKTFNLTFNLPNVAINCIVYDKQSKEGLYIGTDVGTFYKDTSMGEWLPLNSNMPNVVVTDLSINYKHRLLYAATFGRGIWKTSIKVNSKFIGPYIEAIEPGDNSVKINPKSQLILYFNEPVKKGSGIISIFETNVEKQRINVNSDSVVIEGNKVVITPAEFTLGKLEYVRFPKGTFLDLDNNEHKGILSNTEWNFTITTSTNIENISANNPVIVYPNPSNGLVHVQTLANVPVKAIRIYNYLGGLVFEQNIFENTCCDIDLKQLPAGLYNFVIEIENQQIIKHILIN
jgi:photosystem II stability/assembly factor-like uncharacterized protein